MGREQKGDVSITQWQLRITNAWTLGATELTRGQPRGTALLVADTGRGGAAEPVARLLAAGQRVVVLDPFYFGEARPATHDYLWALTLAAVGERSLGLQASQVDAVARWLQAERPNETVTLCSAGPRSSVVALVAAALEPSTVAGCDLRGEFASLKAVITENHAFNDMPELFCFGLLRDFDMEQLKALARTH